MASEITLSTTLSVSNGFLQYQRQVNNLKINQSAPLLSSNVQSIATTVTAISIGSAVTPYGLAWFRNLDATNYVQIGVQVSSTFYPLLRLKPGEGFPMRLDPVVTLYAKANGAAVNLESAVLND